MPLFVQHDVTSPVIDEIKPEAIGIAPLTMLRNASGPPAMLPFLALPRTVVTRGHIRAINAQDPHGTAKMPRRHLLDAMRHRLA